MRLGAWILFSAFDPSAGGVVNCRESSGFNGSTHQSNPLMLSVELEVIEFYF